MSAAMDRPQQRPRSKSSFSFKSDKSQPSKHQRQPSDQKDHLHASTKADPNAAMNEVQPIATALEKPTLQSLRSFQHTDLNGQPIVDPDLSNPTRSRWERPLDTIRSFEAAIDNEYRRRAQTVRGGGADGATDIMSGYGSRRSSCYGGADQNRFSQAGGGYYGNGYRQAPAGRESWAESGHGPMGAARSRYSRMQADPAWNRQSNGHNVYPTQGYQQSRDTVNTHGSNGSQSDPYSNDPSENSSIERGGPVQKPDLGEQYGFSGFGGGPQPILEEYGNGAGPSSNGYNARQQNSPHILPPIPAKTLPPPPPNNPNVIKLSNSQQGAIPAGGDRPNVLSRKSTDASEKRRSWFKKRFSKN